MIKILILTAIFLSNLVANPCLGQESILSNGPQINFDNVIHDYGIIEYDADGNCYFDFTNSGNAPLIISKVINSCGCIVPTYPTEPILPGKCSRIKVKYSTRRIGGISKSLTVVSNATNSSQVVIRIIGTILPKSD